MPQGEGWDVPQEVRGDLEFRWWRVAGNRILVLLCLSNEPVWYRGHFYKGRMVPCAGGGCKLCNDGVGAQLRYVVAAAEVATHRSGLLEVGHTVAQELRDLAVHNNGLRGVVMEISKHSFSRQCRMEIRPVVNTEGPWWREIDYPDPRTALYLGWQKAGYDVPEFAPVDAPVRRVDEPRRPDCMRDRVRLMSK